LNLLNEKRTFPRGVEKLVTQREKENPVMRKSIISGIAIAAMLCACPMLQSCSDSSSQTTYTTTSEPGYGYSPTETSTTTTTTTTNPPDSVVGATADAAGTIVEAPFRIVGDALGVIF
jgi:hypothetical protein